MRFVVNVGWDDVPHLDEAWKTQTRESIHSYQRPPRTRGVPYTGLVFHPDAFRMMFDELAIAVPQRPPYVAEETTRQLTPRF